jgi:uncharacterized membrane protein
MPRNRITKTPLEWLLFAWTAINVVIGAAVVLPMLGNAQLRATGYLFAFALLLGVLLILGLLLAWKLMRPTFAVLVAGAIFWGLQIFSLRLPDAMYLLRLGLSMDFRLTSDPNFIVAVNVLAVMITLMFVVAAKDRRDQREGVAARPPTPR